MSNQNITRLVVGESIPLSMGVPVGQDLGHADVSNTLRWRGGRWETNVGILDMVKKSLAKTQNVLQLPATKTPNKFKISNLIVSWKLAAGVVAGLIVCTSVIYAVLSHKRGPADAFSVVADARKSTGIEKKVAAVRTVDEPWIRPAPEQPAPVSPVEPASVLPAVPVVPGSLTSPRSPVVENRAVTHVQAPAAMPEGVKDKRTVEAKPADVKPLDKTPAAPEAVILDMEPATAAKAKEVTGVQINTSKMPVKDVPKRVNGSGLVAVTPDGKTALFTNTATRLPEKFAVGDKLPSGEIIKSIDGNAGIVKTNAKEYRLE
ncbi:hypothetical protein [Polaromonas aquatica]|uniref:Uncharacterized protein n=1 Tax=Polaromonas aquatica TaxID=332657 RepID=A0ABW1TV59_9BURK